MPHLKEQQSHGQQSSGRANKQKREQDRNENNVETTAPRPANSEKEKGSYSRARKVPDHYKHESFAAETKEEGSRTAGCPSRGQAFFNTTKSRIFNIQPEKCKGMSFFSGKWFELFKNGVTFLAELSSISSTGPTEYVHFKQLPIRKPTKLGYMSWSKPGNAPYGRALAIQKAKAASKHKFQSGAKAGHGVPPSEHRVCQLAECMANTFFSFRSWEEGAMEALNWLSGAQEFKQCSWYGPMLQSL